MGGERHRGLLDAPDGDEAAVPQHPTFAHVATVVGRTADASAERAIVAAYNHAVELPYQLAHVGALDEAGRWHLGDCRDADGDTVPATVRLGPPGSLTPTHPDLPSWRLCLDCVYKSVEAFGPLWTVGQLALVDELTVPPDGIGRLSADERLWLVHRRVEAVGRAALKGFFFNHLEPEDTRDTEAHLVAALEPLVDACRDEVSTATLDRWLAEVHRTRREILLTSRPDELRRDFPDGSWLVLSGFLPWEDPTVTLALLVHTVAVTGDGVRVCVLPASAVWCARPRPASSARLEAGDVLDDVVVVGRATSGEDVAALAPTVVSLVRDGMDPSRALEAARALVR